MKGRELKRIWGKPWDYEFLLKLEQYKIREMIAYFKKHHHLSNWEFVVRDMQICDKLISIVLEEDKDYRGWLDANYGEGKWCYSNRKDFKYVRFHIKVNTKNSKRFFPLANFNDPIVLQHPHLEDSAKICLRQQKALFLYNKIRAYRMKCWWD
jgi:hypothetical protein